jgi:hypothetical protein
VKASLVLCLLLAAFGLQPVEAADQALAAGLAHADFGTEHPALEARLVADWVARSADSHGLPFAIVDKVQARVFVFQADAHLRGAAAVLLGLTRGDDAVPGIGQRALSTIRPEERTTPAGRFVASLDINLQGVEVLWVDYDGAISLHRVVTTNPKEHRLERLASATPLDNRISFGCINVPAAFFDGVIRPAFAGTQGIVYVLPETRPARQVFDMDEAAGSGQSAP